MGWCQTEQSLVIALTWWDRVPPWSSGELMQTLFMMISFVFATTQKHQLRSQVLQCRFSLSFYTPNLTHYGCQMWEKLIKLTSFSTQQSDLAWFTVCQCCKQKHRLNRWEEKVRHRLESNWLRFLSTVDLWCQVNTPQNTKLKAHLLWQRSEVRCKFTITNVTVVFADKVDKFNYANMQRIMWQLQNRCEDTAA